MLLSQTTIDLPAEANEVVLDGATVRSGDYSEEIITGFRCMYRFLLAHQDELLSPEALLSRFADCPIRAVWRATAIYAKMLNRLTYPKFLRDGVDRWIELCIFQRPLLQEGASPACWRLIEAEVASLERLDVPFFSTRTDCLDLWTGRGNKFADVFVRSALEQRYLFLMRLSEEDMEHQVGLMRTSLDTSDSAISLSGDADSAFSEDLSGVR
jgi:lantibiotic modifying enzyme